MKSYFSEHGFDERSARTQVKVKDSAASFTYTLPHHPYHSPDGFAWGYSGSGPTELAKDILWDMLGQKPEGRMYMDFREAFITSLPQDKGFTISEQHIRMWLTAWNRNDQTKLSV